MTTALIARGVRAHCGCAAELVADDGLHACSQEHLLLARMLGPRQMPEQKPPSPVQAAGSISRTREVQLQRLVEVRRARARALALRHLRTLCEDADELLGQVAQAAREGDAAAAVEPLEGARRVVGILLGSLQRPVPQRVPPTSPVTALEEDDVQAALALLEELDSQLADAGQGYRGAGSRAAQLAERLMRAIDGLDAAVATGRTRARGPE